MPRNKEALILVLDVGPSMHFILPEVEKLCSMLVEKMLIFSKYSEVGIILFGTADTKNRLTKEVGGYEHVTVLRDIKVVDGDLVQVLQKLPRGSVNGDFLDAIIVGMDMLIRKNRKNSKGKKRLCLITNAVCPIKESREGTKEDQVNIIASRMKANDIKMESVIVRMKNEIMEENDMLLKAFSNKSCSKSVYVESPISFLGALRTRSVLPVTVFRGDLELSSDFRIKVWVYKKTCEDRFPTLKTHSDKASKNNKRDKSIEDPYKTVRIKGFRYGPQVIPISNAELEAVKFKPEKGVKLLGFTDAKNIMRHYYMKDVNFFIAEPGNEKAILAISGLARAMKEMNKVAIVRCVWRQGQGSVIVGVLTPNVSEKGFIADSFYFNVLPFAEDVREFQFPSFSNFPSTMQPNVEQQEAADKLVMMLDLAPQGKEEALHPDLTPNPVLERFYRYLELKSRDDDAAVPPVDKTLSKITEPDPRLLLRNKSVLHEFRRSFELKESPKLKKSTSRLLGEKPFGSNEYICGEENTSALKAATITDVKEEAVDSENEAGPFMVKSEPASVKCEQEF